MPDFTAPEYASYIALMRELRPVRHFEEGDHVWVDLEDANPGVSIVSAGDVKGGGVRSGSGFTWLPQLADWLDMLEAAGWPWTATGHLYRQGGRWGHCVVRAARSMDEWSEDSPSGSARTREEAAARLWMAVTGSANPQK